MKQFLMLKSLFNLSFFVVAEQFVLRFSISFSHFFEHLNEQTGTRFISKENKIRESYARSSNTEHLLIKIVYDFFSFSGIRWLFAAHTRTHNKQCNRDVGTCFKTKKKTSRRLFITFTVHTKCKRRNDN